MTQPELIFEPMTQTEAILRHLQSGRTITPLAALNMFGCLRLGSRIFDIKKLGFQIESKMVEVGNNKRVAQYRLLDEEKSVMVSEQASA